LLRRAGGLGGGYGDKPVGFIIREANNNIRHERERSVRARREQCDIAARDEKSRAATLPFSRVACDARPVDFPAPKVRDLIRVTKTCG
jgi:hypothetical protein